MSLSRKQWTIIALATAGVFYMYGKSRTLSAAGLAYIENEEGWSATPYKDEAGYDTIGFGHKIKPGESFTTITKQQGVQILRNDVSWAEAAVNSLVVVPLNQNQFDALVDFVFNVGKGAFATSTLLAVLNVGNYQEAADQMLRWVHVNVNGKEIVSNVLTARRQHDSKTFLA